MNSFLTLAAPALITCGLLLLGCQPTEVEPGADGASKAQVDSLINAYEYAWENEDADTLDGILAAGFTRRVNDEEPYGLDSLKRIISGEGGLRNVRIDVSRTVYGDGTAAGAWTVNASVGDGGPDVSFTGASFFAIEDGRIAEEHAYIDQAPLQQAGGGDMPQMPTQTPSAPADTM